MFPDDASCLDWLRAYLCPDGIFCKKCNAVTKHHRVQSRPSYSCDHCGHHVQPAAGTIFHKSRTSLRMWFHAIYLMASTRCGISAKQIERETGVTHKTAWRIFKMPRPFEGFFLRRDGDILEHEIRVTRTSCFRGDNLDTKKAAADRPPPLVFLT